MIILNLPHRRKRGDKSSWDILKGTQAGSLKKSLGASTHPTGRGREGRRLECSCAYVSVVERRLSECRWEKKKQKPEGSKLEGRSVID